MLYFSKLHETVGYSMFFFQNAIVMSMRCPAPTTPVLEVVCVLIATITPRELTVMNVLMGFTEMLTNNSMTQTSACVCIL